MSKLQSASTPNPAYGKHRRYQERMRNFRAEAEEQRERVRRLESQMDAILALLRGHIELPKEHAK
jgi:hypothetical protein